MYGNCTISGDTAVAQANPIRYRGYYYDDDTGLYYCNARYYSPKWRRFISPDDTAYLDPSSVNGLNQYCYCGNDPINIVNGCHIEGGFSDNNFNYIGLTQSNSSIPYANGSNLLGSLHALSNAFVFFDKWSGYLSGGIDAGLNYWGPNGFFKSLGTYSDALSKFGKGMIIAGSILSWHGSVYNNFSNPRYTVGEAFGASVMDAAYYTAKGFATYYAGQAVGNTAFALGLAAGGAAIAYWGVGFMTAFAIGGGVAVLAGFAGAVAIYYLGVGVDFLYEEFKKWIFE